MTLWGQSEPTNYYFRNIRKQDGLSQTDIKAIIQSRDGFMWFGTRNKLNRYDGRSFRVFDCYDMEKNFRNNNVSALCEENDSSLWVGTDKGIFKFHLPTESFCYIDAASNDGVRMTDWVAEIVRDKNGSKWIVIPNQGVFRLSADGKLRHYHFGTAGDPDHGAAASVIVDRSNRVWVATSGDGVHRYNPDTDSFERYLGDAMGDATLAGENIYCIADMGEDLAVGVHEGKLRMLNKRRNVVTDFNAPQVHYKIIRDIEYYDGKLWVGTQSGVYVIDRSTDSITHISTDPMCDFSLSDNQIGKIYRDRENGIWIGTNLGGLNYLSPYSDNFARFVPMSNNSVSSKRVRGLMQHPDGEIWIVTEDAGICTYNEKTHNFRRLGKDYGAMPSDEKCLTLLHNDDNVWIGFFKNGLDVVNTSSMRKRHYSQTDLGLNEASIYAMCEDSRGNIWIGNGWCVYRGSKSTMKFEQMEVFGYNYVFDIIEDAEGNIWVATMGRGVYCYNPETEEIKHFYHNEDVPSSLSSNSVNGIFETSRGQIWCSTDRGGISRYNPSTNDFTNYGPAEGLPDDTAYRMLEDKNGYLWFGTNNGLVKFNPESGSCQVYTTGNGLPSNQFGYGSVVRSNSGKFYFGCSEGLTSFDPENIAVNESIPPVYITKLVINDSEVTPSAKNSPLQRSTIYTNEIELDHDQNMIGFEVAVLSYVAPNSNIYAFKMEGVNADWIQSSTNNTMTYANLAPGRYTFRLKGANSDGIWNKNEVRMSINVLPPWWLSNIAKFAYILLGIAAIWLISYYYSRRLKHQEKEREQLRISEQERELYRYKLDLYVKIAHEIRTPVTLVNGPLETLLDMKIADPEISRNLKTMRRSVRELIDITNQLLDFRKIDSNMMDVHLQPIDLLEMMRDKVDEFTALCAQKGIDFQHRVPDDEFLVMADRAALTKIFNNLLSNAYRYCSKLISIKGERIDNEVVIKVVNDGDTIPEEYQEKIFDPFYQMEGNANADSSTGIGLNVARSLAEMLNGSLIYTIDEGLNCFTLRLEAAVNEQVSKESALLEDDSDFDVESVDDESSDDSLRESVILIVEDNVELLDFLSRNIGKHFEVLTANNGREALEVLKENNVSMVITDVMMPEMDGIELCSVIKSDIESSHIPVIMLTAKNDLDSKIKGLRTGADAFIAKPFSFKHLYAQIVAIFENRRRDKEAFNRNPFINHLNVGISKADRDLINKVTTAIEENITNPNFGVEMLAEITCLSRSSLHRKIKAVSDSSPTDFIRLIRLKKATELIAEGSYRVGEICYLVGINSPSYFTKLFQRQFGMTPKEFEKRQRQQSPDASISDDTEYQNET